MSHGGSSAYRMQVVTDEEGFTALEDSWNSLLKTTECDVVFLRWEWLWTWWNSFRVPEFSLHILLFFMEGELVGICPFYIQTRRYFGLFFRRVVFFLGTTTDSAMSEYMDIIASDCRKPDLVRLALAHFQASRCCDEVFLCKIRSDSKTCAIVAQESQRDRFLLRQTQRYESACVRLPDTYDVYFSQLSSNMRTTIRTRRKRLDSYTEVVIKKTTSESELVADFKELVRLHQMRWTGRGYRGSFADPSKIRFHETILPILLKGNMLDLWSLSINGQNIGALYNICYNGRVYFYQSGIDTDFDTKLSPGIILHNYGIQDAIKHGMQEYDFMIIGKNDEYKRKFTKSYIELADYSLGFSVRAKVATTVYGILKSAYHIMKELCRQDS